jgi:hypothetical protein
MKFNDIFDKYRQLPVIDHLKSSFSELLPV